MFIGVKNPAIYPAPKTSTSMANISATFVAVQHLLLSKRLEDLEKLYPVPFGLDPSNELLSCMVTSG